MMSERAAAEMLELSQIVGFKTTTDSVKDGDQVVDSETLLTEILQHVKKAKQNKFMCFDAIFFKSQTPPITWTGRPREKILLDILAATEIIETILGFVEHATLLQSRDVSGQFRALIDTSPALQRRLFLLPDFSYTHPEPLRVLRTFPNGRGHAHMCEHTDADDILIRVDRHILISITAPDMILPPHDPIWNRMLVTQPPIKKLAVSVPGILYCQIVAPGGGGGSLNAPLMIKCESGVTLGLLYNAVQSHIDFHKPICAPTCISGRKKLVKSFGGNFSAKDNPGLLWGTPIELCERPPKGEEWNKRRGRLELRLDH